VGKPTITLTIFSDRQRYPSVLEFNHSSGGGKLRRLAANKQTSHRFHMERFNLKKLNETECKEQIRVEVSNGFAALQDLDAGVEINSVWGKGSERMSKFQPKRV
jgi:hypothetical protein